jgi:hypothetical protein
MAENLKIVIDVDVKDAGEVKSLKGDLTDLGKAGKSAAPGLDAAGKASVGMSGAIKGLVAGGILAAAGQQLLAFGKASIEAASNAQEMQSKFNIVFGDLAGQVTSDLTAFADAANRSQYDLMGFAATLQDTLKPMGIAPDLAADLSTQLVKLGTDLSSFNNMSMDEALQRLQGTLIGSHENALAFGVVINENTLKAELAANGWDKLTGAQLEAAKVQARINLLMAGTSDAQGDAIRTADSYANQVKGMQAAMNDLQVTVGSALLPVMSELVGLVTKAVDRLSIAAKATGEYGDAVEGIIDSNIESAKSFDELVAQGRKIAEVGDIWGGLGAAITGTEKEIVQGVRDTASAMANQAGSFEEFSAGMEEAFGGSRQGRMFQAYLTQMGMTEESFYKLAIAQQVAADAASEAAAADTVMLNSWKASTAAAGMATDAIIAYSAAAAEARGPNEDLADKQLQLANHTGTAEQSMIAANLANDKYFAGLEEQKAAAEAAAAAQAELARTMGDTFTTLSQTEGPLGIFNEELSQIGDHMVSVGGRTADQNADLARLQEAYNKAAGTLRDYELGVKGANLSDEARAAKIAEQQGLMAELSASMEPLLAVSGELMAVNGSLTVNQDALYNAMYAAADSAGANAGALALLKVATGELTEAQAAAIIKQIALEQTLTTLAEAYAQGDITLGDYMTAAQQAVTDINNMTVSMDTMTGSVTTSRDEVNQLVGVMGEIPSEIATHISITSDPLPNMPGGGNYGPATGGGVGGGTPQAFASGTDGWQTVPGPTGAPYPVTLHGGEAFNVVPVGGGGASTTNNNSNSVNVVQNFTGSSPDTMAQARNGTMAALREAGITGFG